MTFILLTNILTASSGALVHASRDSVPVQQVILEVRIGDIASSTISALRIGDAVRLPVQQLLALAEVRNTTESPLYMSSDSLSLILRASIAVDWDDLVVTIADDGTLPVSRRLARAHFRERLDAMRQTSTQDALLFTAQSLKTSMLPDDIVVDYDIGTSSRQLAGSGIRIALGANLMGGVLTVDWTAVRGYHQSTALSWNGISSRSSLSNVHLGAISFAHGTITGNGVSVSNEPPTRFDSVVSITLDGPLGRGWDFEIYRDALLVDAGIADSSGTYAQSIPLLRGINRLTIDAYGPDGSQRVINRYISIGGDMIPAHTAIYSASFGKCTLACDFAGEFAMKYSPFQRITASAGVTALARGRHYILHPSAQLATHIRDDINTIVEIDDTHKSADLNFAPSPEFNAQASYRTSTNTAGLNTRPLRWSSALVNAQVNIPQAGCSLAMDAELSGFHLGDEQRVRLTSSVIMMGAYIRPFVSLTRADYSHAADVGGLASLTISRLLPPGSLLSIGTFGARSGDGFVSITIPVTTRGSFGFGAERGGGVGPRVTTSFSITSAAFRYESRGVTQNRSITTTHTLAGSAELSLRSGKTRFSALQSRGRTRIEGVVFLDENDNGLRDPDENVLPEAVVMMGPLSVETDSTGAYTVQDAVAFVPLILSVDPLTLPSVDMRPHAIRVVPLPDGVTHADVPVSINR
jgi:hypothetical protein